jgi:predicted nucleic-acid-binding Zn-ribbon protein
MDGVWKCPKCGQENGPLRDVFCGKCGARRPGW